MNPQEKRIRGKIESKLQEMGQSEAVQRFLNKYGKDNTKRIYAISLALYLRRLRERGINLTPDELVVDNLRCIYESSATDVQTKRKHTDWLDEYINRHLVEKENAQNTRIVTAAAIQQFYARNDSPLFGDFQVSRQSPREPPRPLDPADVRSVLKALAPDLRTPLLCVWQSGVEINRVLSLTWGKLEGIDHSRGDGPLKLEFYGRKKHSRAYYTFLGRDAVEHLRIWHGRWVELRSRRPEPHEPVFLGKQGTYLDAAWLNARFRKTAVNLRGQGLVANGDPASWHSHALRHSFRTEASHAGVKSEISEFFLGHTGGISYVYNHRDELHPEDLVREYLKVEPHVSLDYTEAVLTERFEEERRSWISEIASLRREVARLAGPSPRAPRAG